MKGNVVETRPGILWVKHDWLCKRFMHGAIIPEDLFFANPNSEGYICIPKFRLDEMEAKKAAYDKRVQSLRKTAALNNKGMEFEKSGKITQAIKAYEESIALGYDAQHSFDRLAILYRKAKDYNNEIRVIKKALEVFKDSTIVKKYADRLEKAIVLSKK